MTTPKAGVMIDDDKIVIKVGKKKATGEILCDVLDLDAGTSTGRLFSPERFDHGLPPRVIVAHDMRRDGHLFVISISRDGDEIHIDAGCNGFLGFGDAVKYWTNHDRGKKHPLNQWSLAFLKRWRKRTEAMAKKLARDFKAEREVTIKLKMNGKRREEIHAALKEASDNWYGDNSTDPFRAILEQL